MAVSERQLAVRLRGARSGFAITVQRRDETRAVGSRFAMDQERLWRRAHDGENRRDLLAGHEALRGQRIIEMRQAEFARRGDLVVIPGLAGMRAAQVEHRFDLIFANRPPRLAFAQLSRTVEDAG